MNPFSSPYILFTLALVTGIILMVITAVGGMGDGGHDTDHDVVDHDADHDADHDSDAFFGRAISVLGVGRVPLMLFLIVWLMLFGVIGFGLNLFLSRYFSRFYAAISIPVAFAGSVVLTRRITSLFAKILPKTESHGTTNEDLVGCLGVAVYSVTESEGMVQVRDRQGALQKVAAKTVTGEVIPMGEGIVVVAYLEDDRFVVTKSQ